MLCIPEYVLREGHGDCGMLSLLLISALRSEGIPAKWQSGWVANASGVCGMHDWAEVYFEGVGWVPVDMSYGLMNDDNLNVREFYATGLDQRDLLSTTISGATSPRRKRISAANRSTSNAAKSSGAAATFTSRNGRSK